mmetsp:Transcript_39369/g.65317  ORF Transcript_39369/g.65317 Transcript_39369/m.65317 type:complete len:108 (+) Transcript_39369:1-324(+)
MEELQKALAVTVMVMMTPAAPAVMGVQRAMVAKQAEVVAVMGAEMLEDEVRYRLEVKQLAIEHLAVELLAVTAAKSVIAITLVTEEAGAAVKVANTAAMNSAATAGA